jgi:DNA ligase-1
MNRFAALLDRLAYEHSRNAKLRLMTDYFRSTPDPERGFALAAIAGGLSFANAKPGLIRALIAERTDPVLFGLSYDYVGDLSETVALMWPGPGATPTPYPSPQGGGGRLAAVSGDERRDLDGPRMEQLPGASISPPPRGEGPGVGGAGHWPRHHNLPPPSLGEVVERLQSVGKSELPALLARWLDALDETGRWALLKLITGSLRIGVSARLAKSAVAALGALQPDDVEEVWHGLEPPYEPLFAWAEGQGPRPEATDPTPFRPPMLAHPIEDGDFDALDPAAMTAEWKWDGIRVQAVGGTRADGRRAARLYSRTGEDISRSFPDLVEAIDFEAAIDGELLVVREGRVQSFNVLQQRLNRQSITPKMLVEYPAHIRAYDLLALDGEDLRPLPFLERRKRLEAFVAERAPQRLDVSPLITFDTWDVLAAARADPASAGAGEDAGAVEGCMLKRADSPYVPGRPKGLWYKWKHDPHIIDAVLMYAQRGHGKRSSFYSDFTFGVWKLGAAGDELVPVGKAYFGFTDAELKELDRFVRRHTVNRFGPVREVTHEADQGLVLEVAFEGLNRSTRHKSGVAMRFPRISRIRWDKPPAEADRIETLEKLLRRGEEAGAA